MHNAEHGPLPEQSTERIDESELLPFALLHVDAVVVENFLLLVEPRQHSAVIRQKILPLLRRGKHQQIRRHADPHQPPGISAGLHNRPRVENDPETSSLAEELQGNQNPVLRIVQIQCRRGIGPVFQKGVQTGLHNLFLLRSVIKLQKKQFFKFDKQPGKLQPDPPLLNCKQRFHISSITFCNLIVFNEMYLVFSMFSLPGSPR